METNPLKMKPYLCSTFSKSLKSLQYKVYPQWSFKKAISNWTSMPGCTIPLARLLPAPQQRTGQCGSMCVLVIGEGVRVEVKREGRRAVL